MKIAWIQYDIRWEDQQANLAYIENLLEDSPKDFELLILPEMFDTGFTMEPQKLKNRDQHLTVEWMKRIANTYDAAVMGSIIFQEENGFYNRMIFTNGEEIADYDKNHLFTPSGENIQYTAGDQVLDLHWNEFKIRPLICYDLRFPEIARNTEELSLLVYVASWPESRIDHWNTLLKARAIENQCYVLGVNRLGKDGNGFVYNGMSTLYSYDGSSMLESKSKVGFYSENLDKDQLDQYRKKLPFLSDCKLS